MLAFISVLHRNTPNKSISIRYADTSLPNSYFFTNISETSSIFTHGKKERSMVSTNTV